MFASLIFVESNVASLLTASPDHRLVKGAGHHLDFICVGVLTAACSLFGVPWVMGAIPHSPMHARVLATVVEYETRVRTGRDVLFFAVQVFACRE